MAEYNGVGSSGHREHEGVAAAHGAGQHQVDRVQAQRQRHLGKDDFQNVVDTVIKKENVAFLLIYQNGSLGAGSL